METLPLFLKLTNKPVLVVGGGDVALRKVQSLVNANAMVTVVATKVCEQLLSIKEPNLKIVISEYQQSFLQNQRLVIAATNDLAVNTLIHDQAEAADIWVNVVDQSDLCEFTFGAVIDRSPLMIAIGSNGKAPVLARLWKEQLEKSIPRWTGKLATVAAQYRAEVKEKITSFQSRRHFWESVFRGKASQAAAMGNWKKVDAYCKAELKNSVKQQRTEDKQKRPNMGQVFLTGGGPGNPDLLTIKALQSMQIADVIVYDSLISPEVLALCRKDAEMILVGKQAGNHIMVQENINQLLVDLAKQGKIVCRLKGGDPYIFGRGGEEAQLLADNRVPFEVIPGITAAAACSASTGIPLTHRDYSQSVQFVTGHAKQISNSANQGNDNQEVNWKSLALSNNTLVIYMGVMRSTNIKTQLIKYGRDPHTPVAIIEKGTRADQRVITGTLDMLDILVEEHNIGSPALTIIGEVVSLHRELYKGSLDADFDINGIVGAENTISLVNPAA
ncbi:siroheme synthase CysG [Thalassotalea crassostreae]|uniref:siroheme synthase CysG n=1 Tax=Thalassotalea crassostreae TaxID=1763536 RepID=UPI0008394FC3|nr:siroheme synthase CysG [Thalassotalea crassostreae]